MAASSFLLDRLVGALDLLIKIKRGLDSERRELEEALRQEFTPKGYAALVVCGRVSQFVYVLPVSQGFTTERGGCHLQVVDSGSLRIETPQGDPGWFQNHVDKGKSVVQDRRGVLVSIGWFDSLVEARKFASRAILEESPK